MFEIKDNILYKYTGNDKVVIIPDEVEIINTNAFDNNKIVEVIIGKNVKKLCYNAINTPNLNVLKLPNVEEVHQLNDLKKLKHLNVNINTNFASIRYLNPNLKLELVDGNESIVYKSNPNLLNKLEYVENGKGHSKSDFLNQLFFIRN